MIHSSPQVLVKIRLLVNSSSNFVIWQRRANDSTVGTVFRPREDRAGVPLSGDTAQAFLPPNACVFVAK